MIGLEMVLTARGRVVFLAEMFLLGGVTKEELEAAIVVSKAATQAWVASDSEEEVSA